MKRTLPVVFGLLAVGLLVLAGYEYVTDRDPPPGEALVVDDPERDLGSQPGESEIPVRFRLANTSSRPIRVVGLVRG